MVALIRIMIHPPTITSYCLGTTSVKFWQFSVGSLAWIYKNTFKIWISCKFYEIDFVQDKNQKEMEQLKQNIIIVLHIIFAMILNILLACFAKTIFDKKIAERKLKNEEEERMREAGELGSHSGQITGDNAFNFELKSRSRTGSHYNPNGMRDSQRK